MIKTTRGEHFTGSKGFSRVSLDSPGNHFREGILNNPLKDKEIKTQTICPVAKWWPPVIGLGWVESKSQGLSTPPPHHKPPSALRDHLQCVITTS